MSVAAPRQEVEPPVEAVGHLHIGKAAEYRAMSELLLRGAEPMLVSVDRGVDLVLPNGCKVQVRAARKSSAGQYRWKMVQYRYPRDFGPNAIKAKLDRRRSPVVPDFVAFWAVDEDRWFVVPYADVADVNHVTINKHKPTAVLAYEKAWDVLITAE